MGMWQPLAWECTIQMRMGGKDERGGEEEGRRRGGGGEEEGRRKGSAHPCERGRDHHLCAKCIVGSVGCRMGSSGSVQLYDGMQG